VWGGIGIKEANPIVSLIGFDEQKQELKQFLNEEKRLEVSLSANQFIAGFKFHKTPQRVFIVIKQSINFNKRSKGRFVSQI
jgi:F0F1-type ATP synthase beta subunit